MAVTVGVARDGLVVLCGPAACGKTAFARRHFLDTEIVSSDKCRAMLADDEDSQWVSGRAFDVLYTIVRHRLALGRLAVADSTALDRRSRSRLRSLARQEGRSAHLVVFDVSLETCVRRDEKRPRRVGREVIERHIEMLAATLGTSGEEGFDSVTVLAEEEVDGARVERAP